MAFCQPAAVAAVVARCEGRVQAAGHLADHVRLGVAGERPGALCGAPGAIDEVAAGVALKGRVKGTARRAVTGAMVIRLVLLTTVMPARATPRRSPRWWATRRWCRGTAGGPSPCPQVREVRCQVPPPAPPWA